MKRYIRLFALGTELVIDIILNIIIFLTIPAARKESPVFWIAWSFSFVVSFLLAVGLFFLSRKKFTQFLSLPVIYYVTYVVTIVYWVVGLILMYAPFNHQGWTWAIEIIITLIYLVIAAYIMIGLKYTNDQAKEIKEKVLYIRECQFYVDDTMAVSTNAEGKAELKKLSEAIRYSDPMSNEKIEAYEKELRDALLDLNNAVKADPAMDVKPGVAKAQQILARRNALVRMSK